MRGRISPLYLLLVFSITLTGQPLRAAENPRPNIVFILVDDLRWDELGCAGHPFIKTPSIDRIAKWAKSAQGRGIEARKYDIKRLGAWADKLRFSIRALPLYTNEVNKMAVSFRTMEGFFTAARVVGL